MQGTFMLDLETYTMPQMKSDAHPIQKFGHHSLSDMMWI